MPATLDRYSRTFRRARRIVRRAEGLADETDDALRAHATELAWRARTGDPLDRLLDEAFALVRESTRRTFGFAHHDVQLVGGIAMFRGRVAEMRTGEGKTITAALPVFLRALTGRGCHVVTVNDYLARRDAERMAPVYERLGLSVGFVIGETETDARRDAYARDVTYGTATEFGFDHLRDRLRAADETGEPAVHRRVAHFALVDEADSVLVDEAHTPLVIALPQRVDQRIKGVVRWSRHTAQRLERDRHFVYDDARRSARLTDEGVRRLAIGGKPTACNGFSLESMYHRVERALVASLGFQRDRDYDVAADEVVIVDPSTGRPLEGRKWQEGLHQAVEAKEGVPITAETEHAARITMQAYFGRYEHVCGMTGTARGAARELHRCYGLRVRVVPPNRPDRRVERSPVVVRTLDEKWDAVADEVAAAVADRRAVLVGTASVAASVALSEVLTERGIEHDVLNARNHREEAAIVARGGRAGHVVVATDMAGRGTDVPLDDECRANGGLHVVATEMHVSARVDRQLTGRCGRQGDPGSYRLVLSLEDELVRDLPAAVRERSRRSRTPRPLSRAWMRTFRSAQRRREARDRRARTRTFDRERRLARHYVDAGIDPCIESPG